LKNEERGTFQKRGAEDLSEIDPREGLGEFQERTSGNNDRGNKRETKRGGRGKRGKLENFPKVWKFRG